MEEIWKWMGIDKAADVLQIGTGNLDLEGLECGRLMLVGQEQGTAFRLYPEAFDHIFLMEYATFSTRFDSAQIRSLLSYCRNSLFILTQKEIQEVDGAASIVALPCGGYLYKFNRFPVVARPDPGQTYRVSVIVPAFQVEKTLERCIDSILSQTYQDFELVIVNDGSTDGTQGIIDQFAPFHNRVRFISQPHMGLLKARASGLSHAKGEYLLFVDADDWLDGRALEVLMATAEEEEETFDMIFFNHTDVHVIFKSPVDREMDHPMMCGRLFRTDFLRQVAFDSLPALNYSEDYLIHEMLELLPHRSTKIADHLYFTNQGSTLTSFPDRRYDDIEGCFLYLKNALQERGVYEDKGHRLYGWLDDAMQWVTANQEANPKAAKKIQRFYDEMKRLA